MLFLVLMHIPCLQSLPKLEGFIRHLPERAYAGDLRHLVLELRNPSEFSVKVYIWPSESQSKMRTDGNLCHYFPLSHLSQHQHNKFFSKRKMIISDCCALLICLKDIHVLG